IVTVRPQPGHPREIAFSLRPQGAPVWLEGSRDGKDLTPGEVYMAQEGIHPAEVPFKLPEIESGKERTGNIFAPPSQERPGLGIWLEMEGGKPAPVKMDKETCERMKALGYVSASFVCQ